MCNIFNNFKERFVLQRYEIYFTIPNFFKTFFVVSDTEYLSSPISSEPTLQRYEIYFTIPNLFVIIFQTYLVAGEGIEPPTSRL
jgi:hypothetical protein